MEYPIVLEGRTVGNCRVEEQGLYWSLEAVCLLLSDRVERLYSGGRRLGVLEREDDHLILRRRVSRASYPELPPVSGVFSLRPTEQAALWSGTILDQPLTGFRQGAYLLFPYDGDQPCPCEPLFCFFEIKDGFWRLPLDPEKQGAVSNDLKES